MSTIVLTRGELIDLTDCVQYEAQKAALRRLGIDFWCDDQEKVIKVPRAIVEMRQDEDDKPKVKLNLDACA